MKPICSLKDTVRCYVAYNGNFLMYEEWCGKNGYRPISMEKFYKIGGDYNGVCAV